MPPATVFSSVDYRFKLFSIPTLSGFEVTVGICAPQSNLAAILGPVVSFTIIMAALVILLATALFCVLR